MVMYYLGMKYLVAPVVRWQERIEARCEKRAYECSLAIGEARGAARSHAEWRAWYEKYLDAKARGEPQPPPLRPFNRVIRRRSPRGKRLRALCLSLRSTVPPTRHR